MNLYFWDWNNSLTIEKCRMDNPWPNNDLARKEDCFTNLSSAVLAAKKDLKDRIKELQEQKLLLEVALNDLYNINASNVNEVKKIKNLY